MSTFLTKSIKIPLGCVDDIARVISFVGLKQTDIISIKLHKQSVDARDKNDVHFVNSYVIETNKKIVKNCTLFQQPIDIYQNIIPQKRNFSKKVVVVGSGPCGLFCALYLAKSGYNVTVIERGSDIIPRRTAVKDFFNGGNFDENCNVQFGLGGAGTFSDGKLTCGISSPYTFSVFNTFLNFGAPKDIMYSALPHIGTDYLSTVVDNFKKSIFDYNGNFLFNTVVNEIATVNGKVVGVNVSTANSSYFIKADAVFLACGHSARDTFSMLDRIGASLSFKPFAVGLRIEHSKKFIDYSQYGLFATHRDLSSASYKLVYNGPKHSCYSFCMCPGGIVVAANSETNSVVVNGMSNYMRDASNSNSAIVVTVNEDNIRSFGYDGVFAGVNFQRSLESKAYSLGGGNYVAPCQNVTDFLSNKISKSFVSLDKNSDFSQVKLQNTFLNNDTLSGDCIPSYPRGVNYCNLRSLLPQEIGDTLADALNYFNGKIRGFGNSGVLTGVETRTSSPIRIVRDKETLQSNIVGLYPMGEGAGYAGGIVSASVDGIRCAIQFDKMQNS